MENKEEIIQKIKDELHECLRGCACEDSINEIIDLDLVNQTITIKFNLNIVPEDNYIGLGTY